MSIPKSEKLNQKPHALSGVSISLSKQLQQFLTLLHIPWFLNTQ